MKRQRKKSGDSVDPRSALASVDVILQQPDTQILIEQHSRQLTVEAVQHVLANYRKSLTAEDPAPDLETVVSAVADQLAADSMDRLRPVVNAAGVVLHTGLGRCILSEKAVNALAGLNRCVNLQMDLETGVRGKRSFDTEKLLCRLTGAEAAVIVTNNAAATLLILTALCKGREVIVSRGQLIEIGGSFRLPDCVHQSGAIMRDVGTTNKTHLRDFEGAMNENTAAVMRVNPSNYRIIGFSKEVPTEDLVTLKEKRDDLLVIDDLGCGALIDLSEYGLPKEPTVPESIAVGADIACFSGDKLIGGPQAGIIVGKKVLIDKIRKHPLVRMMRIGKLTDMALEHTLRLFLEPEKLVCESPTIRMLTQPADELKPRAAKLCRRLRRACKAAKFTVTQGDSAIGGGSLPGTPLKTWLVKVEHETLSEGRLAAALRMRDYPVVPRIEDGRVVLDMRTLMDGDDDIIVETFAAL